MLTGTRDYSHAEHVEALQNSLNLDPLTFTELNSLSHSSFGKTYEEIADARGTKRGHVSVASQVARDKLVAPSVAAATYNAFAVELFDDMDRLTATDIRVLKFLASGESAERIAEILSNTTAPSRRNRGYEAIKKMRDKLGARTNAEAIRLGVRYGILNPEAGDPPLAAWFD